MATGRAPGPLGTVQRFINTLDVESVADEVADPAALRAWLSENVGDPGDVGEAEWSRTIRLREALRTLAGANNGASLDPEALQVLNQAAAAAALRPRFQPGGVTLEPQGGGLDAVLGRLVVAVYAAMSDGSWERLKACARRTCRWAFYDGSKNHSATWCSMKVCGNRTKAERFRSRHAAR